MQVIFENEYGSLRFGGGGAHAFRLTEITGLGIPKQEYQLVSYPGERGQKLVSCRDLARVITLAGDVQTDTMQYALAQMNRILYHPGAMVLYAGNRKRKIACRCTDFADAERVGGGFATYVLQFTCDDPAFCDISETEVPIFRRVNRFGPTFTLPQLATERISEADVTVLGDLDTEPKLLIYGVHTSETPAPITIRNDTTGKQITFTYALAEGETVTIDTAVPSITSDLAEGNLLFSISPDTRLTDFKLLPGRNHIRLAQFGEGDTLSVCCRYCNRYMEAVY